MYRLPLTLEQINSPAQLWSTMEELETLNEVLQSLGVQPTAWSRLMLFWFCKDLLSLDELKRLLAVGFSFQVQINKLISSNHEFAEILGYEFEFMTDLNDLNALIPAVDERIPIK